MKKKHKTTAYNYNGIEKITEPLITMVRVKIDLAENICRVAFKLCVGVKWYPVCMQSPAINLNQILYLEIFGKFLLTT